MTEDLPSDTPPIEPHEGGSSSATAFQEPPATLTLRDAMAMALTHNPGLSGFAWEVRAAEARALQASLPPNPEASIEVEDIGGSGANSGFDGAQNTISVSQVFLLGGKLKKRVQVASLERDLSGWDYETQRIEVIVKTTQRFVDVLAAQRRIRLAQEAQRLAALVHDAVTKRVDAGDASPTETTRTGVLLAMSRVEVQRTLRSLQTARYRLAASWGSTSPRFTTAAGTLEHIPTIPSLEAFETVVNQSPHIARWAVEMSRRQAAVRLAKAQGVPDVEVGAGWRYFNETDDSAFVAQLSIPLPLFDRNQGGVLEARYALAKANKQRQAAQVSIRTTLATTYQELASTHADAIALREEVLPAAHASFEAIQTAFKQGGGGYLDMLDAQRTLAHVQGQYIDALVRFHRAAAEVEGLIGQPLGNVKERTPNPTGRKTGGDTP